MKPLVWAFAISIGAHLVIYGTFELGQRLGWWKRDFAPAWLRRLTLAPLERKQPEKNLAALQQSLPLVLVEVDPTQATHDAPKNAKYYASQNSKAANPDAKLETDQPKLNGTQIHVPKTENTPKSKAMPLQPAPPKPAPTQAQDKPESQPKPEQKVGDLAMAKPPDPKPADPKPIDPKPPEPADAAVETHQRPRTLAEAMARQNIHGEAMKQDGGVKNHRVESLDAIGTPFGEYDAEIVHAIQMRWDTLLAQQTFVRDRTGRVVLEFRLNYDGRITDMKVVETTVDELLTYLCQRSITEPSPYRAWPVELRRIMQEDYREVRFTFYYD